MKKRSKKDQFKGNHISSSSSSKASVGMNKGSDDDSLYEYSGSSSYQGLKNQEQKDKKITGKSKSKLS